MRKIFLFLTLISLILSCKNKEADYKYLTSIIAGQINGIGIRFVDIVPDEELAKYNNHYGDTIKNLDLNNDGIDDFELIHDYYNSQALEYETLKIIPLGLNSVCISNYRTNWSVPIYFVAPLKYNDTISINNNWLDSTALLYNWTNNKNSYPEPYDRISINGFWYDNDSIYIGVKIFNNNKQLFGWIDLKKNTLRRYAINMPY